MIISASNTPIYAVDFSGQTLEPRPIPGWTLRKREMQGKRFMNVPALPSTTSVVEIEYVLARRANYDNSSSIIRHVILLFLQPSKISGHVVFLKL